MLMHVVAHGAIYEHMYVGESALILKVCCGRKILCRIGESNLHQWHASLTLYQLSYISSL